jgi:hypothetical protein
MTADGASPGRPATRGRSIGVGALLVVATIFLILGMTAVWIQRQVLDREEWVKTSVDLLEDQHVREALGLYLIDQVYENVDVSAELEKRLPERLQPLAEPAAGALRRAAEENAGELLGTAAATSLWRRANERAWNVFDEVLGEESGDVNLDLRPLIEKAAERGGLVGRAAEALPEDAGQLEVLRPDQLETAQKGVKLLRPLAIVLVLLAIVLYVIAVVLSSDRRRTTVYVGAALVFGAVAVAAVRRVGGSSVVDTLAETPDSKLAVAATWEIGTRLLAEIIWGVTLAGLLLILGAWFLGPGRLATWTRGKLGPVLRDQPVVTRLVLGGLILGLIWWHPVPWTGRVIPLLILAVGAFVWLEVVRRRALEEPSVRPS